jgi:hypothetical protein
MRLLFEPRLVNDSFGDSGLQLDGGSYPGLI